MDTRPLHLTVPLLSMNNKSNRERTPCNDSRTFSLTGPGGTPAEAGELNSHTQQPLRFVANSVSISVNSSSSNHNNNNKHEAPPSPQKVVDKVDSASGTKDVACACDTEMDGKLAKIFHSSIQRRIFTEWRLQNTKKQWKRISRAKDEQIIHLLDKLEDSMVRMVMYCRKQKRRRMLRFWRAYGVFKRHKREIEAKAELFFALKMKSQMIRRWRALAMQERWYHGVEERAHARYHVSLQYQCFKMWRGETCISHRRNIVAMGMNSAREKTCLLHIMAGWRHVHRIQTLGYTVASAYDEGLKRAFLQSWWQETYRSRKCSEIHTRLSKQRNAALLSRAFNGWHADMERCVMSRLLQQCVFSIHMIQNLFIDNTRLASIVDSGRWGEEQIQLLHAAASTLREEKLNLQLVLNQFPWSKDRRLFPSSSRNIPSCSPAKQRVSDTKTKERIPEVFLRLSEPGASRKTRVKVEPMQTESNLTMDEEFPRNEDDAHQACKTAFENLALFSGALQKSGGSIVTSVTTEHLTKADDMYKVMKTVNASFQTMGFSPRY